MRPAKAPRPKAIPALVLIVGVLVAACSSSTATSRPTPSPTPSPGASASPGSPSPAAGTSSAPGAPPGAAPNPTPPRQSSVCRDPREHVYNPDRLRLVNPCLTVTGTVEAVLSENDGDYHIRLRLDPGYSDLVNGANISHQHGDLVLEPVCEIPVTQRDAIATCSGVAPSIARPVVGTHYATTGAYVLDTVHGWMELHPIWDLHAG